MLLAASLNAQSILFLLTALIACGFALAVLFTGNIVRMAFFLVISLAATSGLFFLAGAHFVGAMQLMIYVGGTLVLLIFGVMLTAQERFITMKTGGGEWVLAAIVGGSLLALLMASAFSVEQWRSPPPGHAEQRMVVRDHTTQLGAGMVGLRVDLPEEENKQLRAGMAGYLLPFEIISMHLLVVLVGAAYLARARRRVSRTAAERG